MVKITYNGVTAALTNMLERVRVTDSVRRWAEDSADNGTTDSAAQLGQDGLTRRLTAFAEALSGFQWPESDAVWRNARVAVRDEGSEDAIQAVVPDVEPDAGSVERQDKFYSTGHRLEDRHDLDPGDYDLNLTLGGVTETVTVTIERSDITWKQVMERAADAVNNASLPVQAEVVHQSSPGRVADDLLRTGYMLSLSVEPAWSAQDLDVDMRDVLARDLAMEATSVPTTPTDTATYLVGAATQASAPSYTGSVFDPGETTTLEAGAHAFTWAIGPYSGTVTVEVEDGDDWETVLQNTAQAVNGSTDVLEATVEHVDRPVYLTLEDGDDVFLADGVTLTITAVSPKLGERLSLGLGTAVQGVTDFYDASFSQPSSPAAGEAYIATGGNELYGWYENHVYAFNGMQWIEDVPAAGEQWYVAAEDRNYVYEDGGWTADSRVHLLRELGVADADDKAATAHPGTDGTLTVDGETMESATNTYAVDQGRVVLGVTGNQAETLPLRVVSAMEQVESGLADVVSAYNDLNGYLVSHAKDWKPDFVASWREPLLDGGEDVSEDAAWLGLSEWGENKLLSVDADQLWRALGSDADRAEDLLTGEDGLLTAWASQVGDALTNGVASQAVSEVESSPYPWRRSVDNDEDQALVDVLT